MTINKLTDERVHELLLKFTRDSYRLNGSETGQALGYVVFALRELQEYRKAAAPLTDPERQELIKLRNEDVLRGQQWAQGMQHDPTFD